MKKVPRIFRSGGFIATCLLVSLPALGQVSQSSAPPGKTATLEDSVRDLAGEVKELNATIQELRADVLRSRQETRDLRADLDRTIENLSSKASAASAEMKGGTNLPGAGVATQETTSAPPTSPTEAPEMVRLNRLEEDQQLLQAKVDEQHQTKVEGASKYRVKLSGIALFNLFGNSGTVDNQDVPNLALPRGASRYRGKYRARPCGNRR